MMEFDEIVVKESPGLCRCCLSEGCYKDMGTEYTWMNENEVYADMLLECFDIGISQHNEGPNGPNRLICEVCITRLRDACNFKKQVLDSEKKFIDMIGRGEFRPKVLIYQAQMKAETEDMATNEVEYLDDDIDFGDADDDLPLKQPDEPSVSEDITVSTLPVKNKRGRPRKTVVKTEKKSKLAKAEARTSKAIVKDASASKNRESEKQRKLSVAHLLTVIIENSTIIPFRWYRSKYMCFYCNELFAESSQLKVHCNNHKDIQLSEVLRRSFYKNDRIKLDVVDLWCTLCSEQLKTFDEYINHISERHDLYFEENVTGQFHAFLLSDNEIPCPECDSKFKTFALLLYHLNKTHLSDKKDRSHICGICGKIFSSLSNIDAHVIQTHRTQKCKYCHQIFSSRYALETHVQSLHETDYLKCPFCPEILKSKYLKQRHLALVHNYERVQFKCEFCSMIFTRHHKLMIHIRRVHLKEKNRTCEICGFKGFGDDSLKRHMVKHDASRPFQCAVCDKTFQRKITLKAHMRTHITLNVVGNEETFIKL